ncbi:MAG: hypothetical protein P1U57_01525 [Oleibacter sp.]|nr:hypothetical protein [Thalassolituus sp.]
MISKFLKSTVIIGVPCLGSLVFGGSALATPSSDEFLQWQANTQQEFQSYLDENDRAFLSFLKQRWEEVDTSDGDIADDTPKPVEIPVAPPAPLAPEPKTPDHNAPKPAPEPIVERVIPTPALPDVPTTENEPVTKPSNQPPILPPVGMSTAIQFFGYRINLPYTRAMAASFVQRPTPETIAERWEALARSDYSDTVKRLEQWQNSLKLSDWASARLISQYAEQVAPDTRSQTLLAWFLMVKLGYDARLAYNNQLWLLLPADDEVFNVNYFTLSGQRYYSLPIGNNAMVSGKIFTYGKQHEQAKNPIRFRSADAFIATGDMSEKSLKFTLNNQVQVINIRYPAQQIAYLASMPQLNLPRYPLTEMPAETRQELLQQLRPLLSGLSEEAAVNVLLNFVQTAFQYETDEQQFNEENYLFPLETLHYAASDCEDRAALFSQLVHELLGLPVVLLNYPGHVAAAVAFSKPVNGDQWTSNNRTYTVTDPTYINARVGMTMPQFSKVTPKVVRIF